MLSSDQLRISKLLAQPRNVLVRIGGNEFSLLFRVQFVKPIVVIRRLGFVSVCRLESRLGLALAVTFSLKLLL